MERGTEGKLTVFGATLLDLMARRGLRQWKELSALLDERGYSYSAPRISHWAFGRHPAERAFGRAVAEALDLDEKETTRLARALMLGQDITVGTSLLGVSAPTLGGELRG